MAVCKNILCKGLQSRKLYVYLPLPRNAMSYRQAQNIQRTAYNLVIFKLFIRKMPRNENNLTVDARGASASTPTARKTVFMPVLAQPIKRYYQVSLLAGRNLSGTANLHSTHPYLAASREEAISMACNHLKNRFPRHVILTENTVCYPINRGVL